MPYPGETFINAFGAGLSVVADELRQYYALMQGYLSAEHNDDGTHGNITAKSLTLASSTATGATANIEGTGGRIRMTGTDASRVGGDFYANYGVGGTAVANESSLRGNVINASVAGPALVLGRDADAYRWFLVANDLLGSGGTQSSLEFIAGKDSSTYRRAMRLSQADTPVSGAYYLLPPVDGTGGKLYIGAPSGAFGAFSGAARVEAAFVQSGVYEAGRAAAMGYWTSVAYNSANFTADVGAWTVGAGDQTAYRYMLVGKTMYLSFDIRATDVTAAAGSLKLAIPGGFTAATPGTRGIFAYSDAGGATALGQAVVLAGGTTVDFFRLGAAWTITAAGDTAVIGQVFFEVA